MLKHTTKPVLLRGQIGPSQDFDELLGQIHERFLNTDKGKLERKALARIAPLKRLNLRLYRELETAIQDLLVAALDAGASIGYELGKKHASTNKGGSHR